MGVPPATFGAPVWYGDGGAGAAGAGPGVGAVAAAVCGAALRFGGACSDLPDTVMVGSAVVPEGVAGAAGPWVVGGGALGAGVSDVGAGCVGVDAGGTDPGGVAEGVCADARALRAASRHNATVY
jgi:hypothetical protein